MLLKITEACSMGCTHCMNDAKPDGKHMTLKTFEDSLNFLIRNHAYHSIFITGGEPTEHPVFPMFMGYAIAALNKIHVPKVLTITTNGFWILDNLSAAKEIVGAGNEYTMVQFQVSTDTRYYPKKLDTTKRIWREKGFILCKDCVEFMYPQGRAKQNGFSYQFKASKCFNVRAITKQLSNPTIQDEVIRETVAQSAGVKDEKGNEIYIPVFCGSAPDAEYYEGELILYQNGTRFEIGKIKHIVDDGAFVYYHEGETTAKTPFDCMRKIANAYVIKETSLGGSGNECKKS